MSKYWDALVAQNAALAGSGKMTMSIEEFRRRIERAYDAGHRDGIAFAKDVEKLSGRDKSMDFLNQILGKGK